MLKQNRTKERLRMGELCIGIMIRESRSPQIIQVLSAAGWDFAIVDAEHGTIGTETLADFASVARYETINLLMRVSDKQYHLIARPLDIGVEGLVCPRVDSREEAELIMRAAKYAPEGERGVSVSGVATSYRAMSTADYTRGANENSLIVFQIESTQALERLDEILAVPGLDAVFIGPEDLSQSMGIAGQVNHPRMLDAYQRIVDACCRHGVASGMHFRDLATMREWIGRGMRFVAYKTDFRLLLEASQSVLQAVKG